jgi:RND superfamily putative drug exporter
VAYVNVRLASWEEAVEAVPRVSAAAGPQAAPGVDVLVTGDVALAEELEPVLAEDLQRAELFAVPLSLVVLLLVLGSLVAAVVPLVLALLVLPTVLALVFAASFVTDVSIYATNIVTMIGLGIVIDYSLIVVYRFREELGAGRSVAEAVQRTSATALRAVIFSGVAVGVGLAVLVALPVPFIRSIGIAGVLIPALAIPVAMTFLPAVLGVLGHRVNRLRVVPHRILRADESDVWRRVATTIMRAPALFLVLGTALLLLLAAPVRELTMGASPIDTLPGDGPAVRGAKLLDAAFGGGATVPLRVLVDRPAAALGDLPARLGEAPGVVGARLAGSASGSTLIDVVGSGGVGSDAASDLVAELRERTLPAALPPGAVALVGGGPAVFADFEDAIYGNFVWLVAGVIAITYVILFRAFRSVFLPLKAVLMNLLSVGGSYGLLVLVFQLGVGADLLGFERTDQVAVWIPVFLFAFLFGLSMDYEVFLLARMREEYDRLAGQPDANARAVATGLAKTGKIITSAALIMVLAFGGLATSRSIEMQQLGFGLAMAVLLDVTLIRTLVVPSLMALMGRWNWWLPDVLRPLAGRGLQHETVDERA